MGAFSLIDLKRESSVAPDDDDGNMLTRTDQVTTEVISYGFDDFDRLLSVSSSISGRKQDNRYHTEGIRKRKLDVNDNVSNEYSAAISTAASKAAAPGSTSPTISYVVGHQILGAEVNGNFRFHLMDAQGSVRDVLDDTGAVVKSFEFNEHGLEISSSGSGTFSPKTYQGGLSVNDDTADSGLWLMGHRHFDSTLGRFISRDPIGFAGGLNLFGTAFGNNPVSKVDPTGLEVTAVYDIKTGTLSYSQDGGPITTIRGGVCGNGEYLNNPAGGHVPFKGPVPPGTYYLGDLTDVTATHPDTSGDLIWVPIIDQANNSDRVYVRDPNTGELVRRDQMYVHAGSISQGCITLPNRGAPAGSGLIGSPEFTKFKQALQNATPIRVPAMAYSPGVGVYPSYTSYQGVLIVK